MRSVRFFAICLVCVLVAVSMAACRTTRYELELHPDGDTMQRKVSMWRYRYQDGVETHDEFDVGKLRYISGIYNASMPDNLAQRHEFEGRFGPTLPDDISDGGWYLHRASTMGSVNVYVEHVDGGHKISWDLETRQKGLHRLVDVYLAWLDAEFGEDDRYPRFRELVDVVIRDDLWNIALYLWTFDMSGLPAKDESGYDATERLMGEILFRVGVYLAARDYFDPARVPELISQILAASENKRQELGMSFCLRGLANKLGTDPDEPLPWPLAEFASDFDAYVESFELFVADSDTIREMADEWEREFWDSLSPSERSRRKQIDQLTEEILGEAEPAGIDAVEYHLNADVRPRNVVSMASKKSVASQLADMAFALDIDLFNVRGADALHVVLHVPQRPLMTNGTLEDDGTVRWSDNITPDGDWGDRLPDVFYALWTAPAVEFQEEHFGKTVLEGEELVEHVGWYMALSPDLAQEWDGFLRELEPGPNLVAALQNFCFSSELAACQAKPDPATPSVEQLDDDKRFVRIPLRSDIADGTLRDIVDSLWRVQRTRPIGMSPSGS